MEVAIAVLGIVALIAVVGLTTVVMFLVRKSAQRDNEFIRLIIDNTMENVMAAFSRGIGERKIEQATGQVISTWDKPKSPMPQDVPDKFDGEIEEIGVNP